MGPPKVVSGTRRPPLQKELPEVPLSAPRAVPWFLRADGAEGANAAEVTVLKVAPAAGSGTTTLPDVYLTDVPEAEFDEMMRRAAAHAGYSPRASDVREMRTREFVLTHTHMHTHTHNGDRHASVGVRRRTLLEARVLPGTPLLVRTYRRSPTLGLSAFPCDSPLHSVCRVRRLELRVHSNARLVFEVRQEEGGGGPERCGDRRPVVRSVRLEADLPSGGRKNESFDDDLRRTVENSIHVVMLGLPPLKAVRGFTSSDSKK